MRLTTSPESSSSAFSLSEPSSALVSVKQYILELFTDDAEWIQRLPKDQTIDHDLNGRLSSAYNHLSASRENENIEKTLEVLLQHGLVVPKSPPSPSSVAHHLADTILRLLNWYLSKRLGINTHLFSTRTRAHLYKADERVPCPRILQTSAR
ncbi:hypothetical protein BGZ65_004464, partial [Modicella reniformis]